MDSREVTDEEFFRFKAQLVIQRAAINCNSKSNMTLSIIMGMSDKERIDWVNKEFDKIPENERILLDCH